MSFDQDRSRSQSAPPGSPVPGELLGSLTGCLVEGDPEQLARERRIHRKALAISVVFQVAVLAVLVLLPIFSTAEKIAYAVTPLPPVYGLPGAPERPMQRSGSPRHGPTVWRDPVLHPPQRVPVGVQPTDPRDNSGDGPDESQILPPGLREGIPQIGNADPRRPLPPAPTAPAAQTTRRVVVTTIEPAMLLRRVEPVYPVIAIQIHREGRVELRAIIATDGTIQSLEVVSGDPMLFLSALDAVRQWRYRPTILNGVPVEVETRITVIYTLQH